MQKQKVSFKIIQTLRGAAIAQWICLRPPSWHPGFESQAHRLGTLIFFSQICAIFVMLKERK